MRVTHVVLILTLLFMVFLPNHASEGPIRVFILAGQSNMEGHGGEKTLDAMSADPASAALLKKIRKPDGTFIERNDVFTYYNRNEGLLTEPLKFGQGAWKGFMGPELGFGVAMGEHFQEPVLLIKTAWGGKDLYCDFRPPSAGKPAYNIPGEPREPGIFYRKIVQETQQCLSQLGKHFPQLQGRPFVISGFVWVQGWNDFCAPEEIQQKVYDEYASNFANLVKDLRAEFKTPKLPVVVAEVGVGGEKTDMGMLKFRMAQSKMQSQPELAGTLGYVRTAPYWYPELNDLPGKLWNEREKVKKAKKIPDSALDKALESEPTYQAIKAEHDKHVSHWECHYQGSARVYANIGLGLAEAMKRLLKK